MVFKVVWIFLLIHCFMSVCSVGFTDAAPLESAVNHRVKRYDTSLLTAHCGGLRNRCRHIPPATCVRACVHGQIKRVCRIPPTGSHDRRCLVY